MAKRIYVYLNGHFVGAGNASVSVRDRGFRFGDGVFETVRVQDGHPYRLAQHLARLAEGLRLLNIAADIASLPVFCLQLIRKNAVRNGILRIVISRGEGSRGYLPEPDIAPTVLIETQGMPSAPEAPVDLWLSAYEKISPRALPVQMKLCQGLNASLARMEAQGRGCFDALQVNHKSEVCEASSSNIFWLEGDMLFTPALSCGALAGVTRETVLKLSPWPVREGAYLLEKLAKASAVVLTNTVINAVPVRSLKPLGWHWESEALAAKLRALIEEDILAQPKPLPGKPVLL
jgi:branched-subunit amino acid aminotransferase/4-amino-4-deoxychorismate lyase